MRIVVTGAAGFIGRHVARQLLLRGHEVAAVVRGGAGAAELEEAGCELYQADVTDRAAMRRALRDTDGVAHLAVPHQSRRADRAHLRRVAIEGSRTVLDVVREFGLRHAVHVACLPALDGRADGPVTAAHAEALAQVVRPQQELGLPVTVVAPALVYGPADPGPVGRMLARLARGRLGTLPAGGAHGWVHVQDAAAGVVAALHHKAGGTYALTGAVHTFREAATIAAGHLGVKPPLFVPPSLARATAGWMDAASRLLPVPGVDAELVRLAAGGCSAPDTPARTQLEWAPRPLAQGLQETLL